MAFVFRLGKRLGNIAFANTTRTIDHHGSRTFANIFPGNKLIVDFSFQHVITPCMDSISLIWSDYTIKITKKQVGKTCICTKKQVGKI